MIKLYSKINCGLGPERKCIESRALFLNMVINQLYNHETKCSAEDSIALEAHFIVFEKATSGNLV